MFSNGYRNIQDEPDSWFKIQELHKNSQRTALRRQQLSGGGGGGVIFWVSILNSKFIGPFKVYQNKYRELL